MGRSRLSAADRRAEGATGAYDALAPHYRQYARSREAYLDAVDQYVLAHAPRAAGALLDVGAGDGVRGIALARRLEARRVVLAEPSREMAARCRTAGADAVWEVAAQDLPGEGGPFDVVLCLWNVLGHVPSRALRIAALRAMRRLLASEGTLFLDVNNRHNARAYGWVRVAARRLVDRIAPREARGDAVFTWQVGGVSVPGLGHLFTPAEIESLMEESGLRVADRVAVDYVTGEVSCSPFRGQLLYRAVP